MYENLCNKCKRTGNEVLDRDLKRSVVGLPTTILEWNVSLQAEYTSVAMVLERRKEVECVCLVVLNLDG